MTTFEPISKFETIETLYNRLKADKIKKHVMFDCVPQYCIVQFTGKTEQTTKAVSFQDEWNFINFNKSQIPTPIKTILKVLKPLIEKHGSKIVLFSLSLIQPETIDTCHKIDVRLGLAFYSTDMNPHTKFSMEFEKVRKILGAEPDIVKAWLKKKCPKDVDVFLIGTQVYIGVKDVLTARPTLGNYNDWKTLFFNQDPTTPTIYTCKLSDKKMNLIFGYRVDAKSMDQFVKTLESMDDSKLDAEDKKKEVTPPVDNDSDDTDDSSDSSDE